MFGFGKKKPAPSPCKSNPGIAVEGKAAFFVCRQPFVAGAVGLDQLGAEEQGLRRAEDPHQVRILSLDGGGIMGAFAASALATFEQSTRRRVVDHFDLITGTSTGGIIAIALAMGTSAQDICTFYESSGPKIPQDCEKAPEDCETTPDPFNFPRIESPGPDLIRIQAGHENHVASPMQCP